MASRREERPGHEDRSLGEEELKQYFEFFKHFTTLTAATAVILLAVQKENVVETFATAASVVMLALSVVLSLVCMTVLTRVVKRHASFVVLKWTVAFLFVLGLGFFVVSVLYP